MDDRMKVNGTRYEFIRSANGYGVVSIRWAGFGREARNQMFWSEDEKEARAFWNGLWATSCMEDEE